MSGLQFVKYETSGKLELHFIINLQIPHNDISYTQSTLGLKGQNKAFRYPVLCYLDLVTSHNTSVCQSLLLNDLSCSPTCPAGISKV